MSGEKLLRYCITISGLPPEKQAEANQQLDRLLADTARVTWLERERAGVMYCADAQGAFVEVDWGIDQQHEGPTLRDAIDAAMTFRAKRDPAVEKFGAGDTGESTDA